MANLPRNMEILKKQWNKNSGQSDGPEGEGAQSEAQRLEFDSQDPNGRLK